MIAKKVQEKNENLKDDVAVGPKEYLLLIFFDKIGKSCLIFSTSKLRFITQSQD